MGGAHAEGSQKREPRAHTSHRGAAVLALVAGAVALVCAALAVGTLYGPQVVRSYMPTLADDLGILVEPEPELERLRDGYDGELARRVAAVSAELVKSAYDAPDLEEATAGALQGLLLSADDHGRYLTEDEYRTLMASADGDAGEGDSTPAEPTPAEPADAQPTPAEPADTEPEGTEHAGAELGDAQAAGSTRTEGEAVEKRSFGSVDAWLDGTMGVAEVPELGPGTAESVKDAIAYLEEKGAITFTLDLTDNPGGSLNEAVALASLFLTGGTVAELVEPDGSSQRLRVNAGACITDAPLAVLVSQDTGSAAELVVGALKDHRRALVVGQTTAGRGTIQSVKTLSFGGAVVYATAEFLTPDGKRVEGVGIEPDFEFPLPGAPASSETPASPGAQAGVQTEAQPGVRSKAQPETDELALARAVLGVWLETGHIEDALRLDGDGVADALRRVSAPADQAATGDSDSTAAVVDRGSDQPADEGAADATDPAAHDLGAEAGQPDTPSSAEPSDQFDARADAPSDADSEVQP